MHTRYLILAIGFIMFACSPTTEAQPTILPEPTSPPEPTATPTELTTEMPPSPTPAPTEPPATPTPIPSETSLPIQFDFSWYENNPSLDNGASGDWDDWRVWNSNVLLLEEVFHMFYVGIGEESSGIGYAISSDGLNYEKFDSNPVFQPDGKGFDAIGISGVAAFVENGTWMLYYNASAEGEKFGWNLPEGSSIGFTTAPDPTGPWSAGQFVLKAGEDGEWDSGVILPTGIYRTEEGYRMYYGAEADPVDYDYMCGMATSQDGIIWTKYDDPSTTESPFANSDPVMKPSSTGWDSFGVVCSVIQTDTGWEMFYDGWTASAPARIGYADSSDGIHWNKYHDHPELGNMHSPTSAIKIGSTYYIYTHDWDSAAMYGASGTIDQP